MNLYLVPALKRENSEVKDSELLQDVIDVTATRALASVDPSTTAYRTWWDDEAKEMRAERIDAKDLYI